MALGGEEFPDDFTTRYEKMAKLSKGLLIRSFPKNILVTWATGKLLHNAHDSRHLLAEFLLSEHHIFMLALAKLR